MTSVFNSRNPLYRNPAGAVSQGQNIHFKICMPRHMGCSHALLCIRYDDLTVESRHDMFWCGMEGADFEWWECDFADPAKGLYWYRFEVITNQGSLTITKGNRGEGLLGHGGACWQLTVYEKNENPTFLKGGLMYQIFPDRFYSSGSKKENIPQGRLLHQSTEEPVVWNYDDKSHAPNSDYFGGDLPGVEEKLPYLQSLGVTCIYLNPIFEAHSNHRYDTADYNKIDPLLGREEDFTRLCAKAKHLGIAVILDGVFSHTGADSLYFNKFGRYPSDGAYNRPDSPYRHWYKFAEYPEKYTCWWGFQNLPEVCELAPDFLEFICGPDGIARKWLRLGASGWRLDVADELPDPFLEAFYAAVKDENPQAVVLGEVWEDATNKLSYGKRRHFLLGGQMDSVMNYPFRDAILTFMKGDAQDATEQIEAVLEQYPPHIIPNLMNHIGTHDTERILTVLAGEPAMGRGRNWQAEQSLSAHSNAHGITLLKLASVLQYTLPGVPCLYYGDEAGLEGYKDPFNRRFYPWGRENPDLLTHYRYLADIRKYPVFADGLFKVLRAEGKLLVFERTSDTHKATIAINNSDHTVSFEDTALNPYDFRIQFV